MLRTWTIRLFGVRLDPRRAMPYYALSREGVPMDGIGLADAIEMLRAEVLAAQTKAVGTGAHFPIQTLTVQLKVGLTKLADGKVGFKVPFVGAELGASAGLHQETTQTVTLVLGPPVDLQGRPISVAKTTTEEKD